MAAPIPASRRPDRNAYWPTPASGTKVVEVDDCPFSRSWKERRPRAPDLDFEDVAGQRLGRTGDDERGALVAPPGLSKLRNEEPVHVFDTSQNDGGRLLDCRRGWSRSTSRTGLPLRDRLVGLTA